MGMYFSGPHLWLLDDLLQIGQVGFYAVQLGFGQCLLPQRSGVDCRLLFRNGQRSPLAANTRN